MITCPHCNFEVDTVLFCTNCGKSLNAAPEQKNTIDPWYAQPKTNSVSVQNDNRVNNQEKFRKTGLTSGLLSLLLAGIGWFIFGAGMGAAGLTLGISGTVASIKARFFAGVVLGITATIHSIIVLGFTIVGIILLNS